MGLAAAGLLGKGYRQGGSASPMQPPRQPWAGSVTSLLLHCRVTGGELFEDIVAREYYSEADAR